MKLSPKQLADIRERLSAVIDLIGSDLQEPFSDTEALLEHITALEAENKALLMYVDHKRWCIKRDPDLHHTRDCNCRFDELLSEQEQKP